MFGKKLWIRIGLGICALISFVLEQMLMDESVKEDVRECLEEKNEH